MAKDYTLRSNIAFSIGLVRRESPRTLVWTAVGVLALVAAPFMGIMMPKIVIDGLTRQLGLGEFLLRVGVAAAIMAVTVFLQSYTGYTVGTENAILTQTALMNRTMRKEIEMDYEALENPAVRKLEQQAHEASLSTFGPGCNLVRNLAQLAANILGLLLYAAVVITVNPIILAVLAVGAAISSVMLRRARRFDRSTKAERDRNNRKLWYISDTLRDRALGKDLRVYGMLGWFRANKRLLMAQKTCQDDTLARFDMQSALADAAFTLVRDGAAYAFLVYLLLMGRMTLGDFVLTFAAIGAVAGWVSGIEEKAGELYRSHVAISGYRAFEDLPDRWNRGTGLPLPELSQPPAVELENVSYTYPGAKTSALEHINLSIAPGERLAVVGLNGAGKTTLVKLICGLYKPTSGVIKLNGVDISGFNRDEYYKLFAAVFQDIHLLGASVAENVAQLPADKLDRGRVVDCLKLAGLDKFISDSPQPRDGQNQPVPALPLCLDTQLERAVNDDAVELSGGEMQKLALARAIYKRAPVILLDEPTAALDPIAESETYRRYAELTSGRTSVYISHRLASTRFCDRVILLDGHTIAEEGTHASLMQKNGKYARMFATQAQYYTEGSEAR